jgi:hypothetical protein
MSKLAISALAGAMSILSAGVAHALPDIQCGSANGWNVGVVGAASCGLALNVARGVGPNDPYNSVSVTAYSPATGLNYPITCHNAQSNSGMLMSYECSLMTARGGIVYLWQ